MSELAFERVVLKTNTLEATVLPELGGKVASLRFGEIELLQGPLREFARRTPDVRFDESDASGFDECLPTVAACSVGAAVLPDHGEFWQLPCAVEQHSEREVRLTATGRVYPLRLERRLTVEGSTLRVDYRLENVGDVATPYLWSAHPSLVVDAGDVIVLPESVKELTVEGSAHMRLGPKGGVAKWPVAEMPGGGRVDLSHAGKPTDEVGDKVFAAPSEGWAAVERRRAGVRVKVEFDAEVIPYLGLWLCYGGWPEGLANRQQCVGLEPCTAPVDSLAEALERGWARELAAGQVAHWWMTIAVSALS